MLSLILKSPAKHFKTGASPSSLVQAFKENVDFSRQPPRPIGTLEVPWAAPSTTVDQGKYVGQLWEVERKLDVRFETKEEGSCSIARVNILDNLGGAVLEVRYGAFMTRKEKVFAISMAALFWGLILFIVALVGKYVTPGEVSNIIFQSSLVGVGVPVLAFLAARYRAKNIEVPKLEQLMRTVIRSAETSKENKA